MIDYVSKMKYLADRKAPNGVPLRLLNGLLEPPVVEGAAPLPRRPANAPAPFQRRGPIQVGNPPEKPAPKKTRSVLKEK